MTETKSHEKNTSSGANRSNSRVRSVLKSAFTILVAVLLIVTCRAQFRINAAHAVLLKQRSENKDRQAYRDQMANRWTEILFREAELPWIEDRVRRMYAHFDGLDEFPKDNFPFVITSALQRRFHGDTFYLTVPKGKYRLHVNLTRKEFQSDNMVGESILKFDLKESASYILRLVFADSAKTNVDSQPLTLNIESNSPDFESVSETLFEQVPSRRSKGGGILSRGEVFAPYSVDPPLVIQRVDWTYNNIDDQEEAWVFTVSLESDGQLQDPIEVQ